MRVAKSGFYLFFVGGLRRGENANAQKRHERRRKFSSDFSSFFLTQRETKTKIKKEEKVNNTQGTTLSGIQRGWIEPVSFSTETTEVTGRNTHTCRTDGRFGINSDESLLNADCSLSIGRRKRSKDKKNY